MLGLLDAIVRYNPDRGVPLHIYVELRIRGAMLDALRGQDWVPRSVRHKHRLVEQARQQLDHILGRAATRMEVAARLDMSLDEFNRLTRDGSPQQMISLDAPRTRSDPSLMRGLASNSVSAEASLAHSALENAINDLPEKDRDILSLSYLQGYTLREVGDMVGVSEARVSHLRSRALRQTRSLLSED